MSNGEVQILCVSVGAELAERLRSVLRDGATDARVTHESGLDKVLERFETVPYDVLVMSSAILKTDEKTGMRTVETVSTKTPGTQILFVVDEDDIDVAMAALKAGSYQYVKLPVSDQELSLIVDTALEQRTRHAPNLLLSRGDGPRAFCGLIGATPVMRDVFRQIRQAGGTDIPVLITGETGTGKDLVAQAIHRRSARREHPYLPVNLGALPGELVASELFGHEKGTFTGAAERREGIFERAADGTVFLDEISSVDEKVQISLLRLIEQKRFHRLGGRTWLKTDVRIVAASNEDLPRAVASGAFREDLYYRLDVFHISVPPLRERRSDIDPLANSFLMQFNKAFDKNIKALAPDCLSVFDRYGWPGNVRELKNVIQRAVLVCAGSVLEPHHLPPRLQPEDANGGRVSFKIGTPLQDVEREMIERVLTHVGDNRTKAAELLGISRRSLYNKLQKYGLSS